jgi:hypothetical protein
VSAEVILFYPRFFCVTLFQMYFCLNKYLWS